MFREIVAVLLIVILISGAYSVIKGPYPHPEPIKPVIMKKYPGVCRFLFALLYRSDILPVIALADIRRRRKRPIIAPGTTAQE